MHVFFLTTIAMIAFASNSLLTRLAILGGHIDPSSFALIRVASGAVVLCMIVSVRRSHLPLWRKSRIAGVLSLTAYMAGFSLAYLTLDAGLGALILFGVVQITMFADGIRRHAGPSRRQIIGAAIAFVGLMVALWPGPGGKADLTGALFMVIAGLGWAVYTISGRSEGDPLAVTAANFLLCLPFIAILLIGPALNAGMVGVALAMLCGGVTSGLGYALWYRVLPMFEQSIAAIVQLSVPVLAIFGGAVFLGEPVSLLVVVATLLVLGGIAIAVTSRPSQAGRS